MIRLFVVDDSAVVRMKIRELLSSAEDVEIVDSAPNGKSALEKLDRVRPDAMLLDLEMPILDGISTLRRLRATNQSLPVLVLSSHTSVGAPATVEALSAGASDFIAKPSARNPNALADLREDLLRKLRAITAPKPKNSAQHALSARQPAIAVPSPRLGGIAPVELLVIASSTGGPNALAKVLEDLPGDLPVPVAVVQHMPATFTPFLARRLDDASKLRVWEATDDRLLSAGEVAIAPGGRHMVLRRKGHQLFTVLNDDPPENSCRPAADPLFRSAVAVCAGRVLAVVLTGMGHDGCAGARSIVEAGGQAIAQDAETSVVWGMPGAVARASLADAILPISDIAGAIRDRLVGAKRARPPAALAREATS